MVIGFIGTGGITEAIVTGLFNCAGHDQPILVSERNRARSHRLAATFDLIEVVEHNQEIVDRCDWVVISVLPEQTSDVLSKLRFHKAHHVISLSAGITLETLRPLIFPATRVCRAIPMPPIEFGLGPTPICPPDPETAALFNRVGTAVAVDNEKQFTALAASSAVMATFFAWVASNARWLESKNVPAKESALYATSVLHALATMTTHTDAEGLQAMSEACLTPGGLNEQVLEGVRKAGSIEQI
ncbi:NAD(P)-binding domain-containing protein, partial [Gammaproteobacteria bacterium]|nr:NAD(P)-binding domain-containing protein [Gammaproteobacteria bacterium]